MANTNFEDIKLSLNDNSNHIYYLNEKCLYKCNGSHKVKYYRCIEKNCNCRGKLSSGSFIRTNSVSHNHHDHEKKSILEKTYYQLKSKVLVDKRPVHEVHSTFLRSIDVGLLGAFSWKKVRHTLLRIRRQVMPECKNLAHMVQLLETNNEVKEVYANFYGSFFYQGTIQDTFLVFANLLLMKELPIRFDMMVDATFKVCPFQVYQLLIILGEIGGSPRPVAYVMMTSCKEDDYAAVFKFIKEGLLSRDGIKRHPDNILCDFEMAMRNALQHTWPNSSINGCFFHFVKALKTKAETLFKNSEVKSSGKNSYKFIVRMYTRLALLPLARIPNAINNLEKYIVDETDLEKDFKIFQSYFRDTWFGRYSINDWCVSNLKRRTNNCLEGYNNFVKQVIPLNPSPFIFLEGLQNLTYDATSTFFYDKSCGYPLKLDRSKLSTPLKEALEELSQNKINDIDFLIRLANV